MSIISRSACTPQNEEALVDKLGSVFVPKAQLAGKVREVPRYAMAPIPGQHAWASMQCVRFPTSLAGDAAYAPGATIVAVVSVIMRDSFSLDSMFMKRLAPESVAEVISNRAGASGLRLRVRDASGQQGWVSAVGGSGAELWAGLPPWLRAAVPGVPAVRPYWPSDRAALDGVDCACFESGERLAADWVRLARRMPQRCFVSVAVVAGAGGVAGYCAWGLERPKRDDPRGPRLYVASLAVHPGQRGKGVGTQLLKHVEAMGECKFPEAEFVALHVRVDNEGARRLYGRLGFEPVAVISRYAEDVDGWEMVQELGPMRQRDVDPALAEEMQAMGFPRGRAERAVRWALGQRRLALQLLQGEPPVVRGASVAMPWVD